MATDACGNTATCTQVITAITDVTPPTITCPADITVQCGQRVPAADITSVTASDACGTVTITHVDDQATSSGCSQTIRRTYMATDACGNTATCAQVITAITDVTPPTITCPADITVQCGQSVPAADITSVTASDACGTVTITHVDDQATSSGCSQTIRRTYMATDACGNTATCTQVITAITDVTPPTITCPADITVQCGQRVPAADITSVTASDACGTVTITHVDDQATSSGCSQTIRRTYMATDACGNTATCAQVITAITDVTPPTITCPADITVQCGQSVPAADITSVTASDACGTVTITHVDDQATSSGCSQTIRRTYMATDACGNTATCTQVITAITDVTPPTITCPADITVQCGQRVPAADITSVTASDACGTVTITHVDDQATSSGCSQTIRRTYMATDACGNTATCAQVITAITDVTPPTITCPADITVQCGQSVPAADITSVTASDACGTVTITHVDDQATSSGCSQTIRRTYMATDACGNTATCTQVITAITDVTPPTLTCAADITVQCGQSVPAADITSVTASDACGTVTITHVDDQATSSGCSQTIRRTYMATDACGNTATCAQVITAITDVTPPTITCPADITVQCGQSVPAADITSVTASDACGTVTITHVDDQATSSGCSQTIRRTYMATDACGNTATCAQVITAITDVTPPTITCPADITVQCGQSVPAADITSVTASDACGTVTITHVDDQATSSGCSQTIRRTYMATDACGNTATCAQVITAITDVTPPTITCPADITVQCGQSVPAADITSVTASDACGTVTITHVDDQATSSGCSQTIRR